MDIDSYKQQHTEIMQNVTDLRNLTKSGIAEHAKSIAQLIATMSSEIKLHLAAEDKKLYPALQAATDPDVVALSKTYQAEMNGIASAYMSFARKWIIEANLASDPDGFRAEANTVFRALHERIQRENRELYPAAERL